MNTAICNRQWSRQFLAEKMTKKFISHDMKNHREQIIFDKERALLPATQTIIEQQKHNDIMDEEINRLNATIEKLRETVALKQREKRRVLHEFMAHRGTGTGGEETSRRNAFIRGCPENGCRGFLSSQWKCGICEKWTCSQCYVVKGIDRNIEHICNPDDLETASLIMRETKSCPNCAMAITKIDGCDQMFCTNCNRSFSWRTGAIQTANIHNPHYFEWLRRTGGDNTATNRPHPDGGGCQNINFNHTIYTNIWNNAIRRYSQTPANHQLMTDYLTLRRRNPEIIGEMPTEILDKLRQTEQLTRRILHLREVIIPSYGLNYLNTPQRQFTQNQDLRIRYLKNQITEDEFKVQLQRRDKKTQKNRELTQIMQTVCDASVDIIIRIYEEMRTQPTSWNENIFAVLDEINELVYFANECFLNVAQTYDIRPLRFDAMLRLE